MGCIGPGELADELARALPELNTLVREHGADWDFPFVYLLLAQVFGEVDDSLRTKAALGREKAVRVYRFVETMFIRGDSNVRNALDIEMLEPLIDNASLDFALGPLSQARLARRRAAQLGRAPAVVRPASSESGSMANSNTYALGYSELEHQRLIRQDERWRSSTERLFREAGVSEGQRVLDLGSGIGDVAMHLARIVGPSGEVVGVELDGQSASRARVRVADAGFPNVTILESDVMAIADERGFDAVAGRFVLQFLPNPATTLRFVSSLLRPHGIAVFQEVAWSPSQAANAALPLWSACAAITRQSIERTGANPDVGLALHRIFIEAGFPEPEIRAEMKMSASRELVLWPHDLLASIRARPRSQELAGALETLGDFATLGDRIEAEVREARCAVASVTAVGACSRLA